MENRTMKCILSPSLIYRMKLMSRWAAHIHYCSLTHYAHPQTDKDVTIQVSQLHE